MSVSHLPSISLVTPSFNQAQYLERTIVSVLEQGYPNLQFGIVDGGSTDGSRDIIERYRQHLNFVILEPDGGQSDAINKGLDRARGHILGWLNSDDTLLPDALWKVARHFQANPQDQWIVGIARRIDENDQTLGLLEPTGQFTLAGALLRVQPFMIPQPASFWRNQLTRSVGFLDPLLHHAMDFELWCRFLAAGARPRILTEHLATYREHSQSKTCAQAQRFIQALIDIESRMVHLLPWSQRMQLRQRIGYQQRALAILAQPSRLWQKTLLRPWWLVSQQIRQALWQQLTHPQAA